MPLRKETREKLDSEHLTDVQAGLQELLRDRADKKHKPTPEDLTWIEHIIEQITDVPTFTNGKVILQELKLHRCSAITDFVWSGFEKGNGSKFGFLGVCDAGISKDSPWMLNLGQYLPGADFIWVPAGNEHWAMPNLADFGALCQIGRSHPSHPVDLMPRDKEGLPLLRFDCPPLPDRGAKITPEDYRLHQSWRSKRYREYETTEPEKLGRRGQYAERVDYGVLQRFRFQYLGSKLNVVRLIGLSSLATAGTILFATEMFSHPEKFDDYVEKAGKVGTLTPSSYIEVLLRVTGGVHRPPILWEPRWEVEKFFINNSPNLACKPNRIWTHPELRFDDDVIDPKEDTAAVIALCRAARQDGRVRLNELVKDAALWPGGRPRWTSAGNALSDYREMQKGVLRGIFSFSSGDPTGQTAQATLADDITIQPE